MLLCSLICSCRTVPFGGLLCPQAEGCTVLRPGRGPLQRCRERGIPMRQVLLLAWVAGLAPGLGLGLGLAWVGAVVWRWVWVAAWRWAWVVAGLCIVAWRRVWASVGLRVWASLGCVAAPLCRLRVVGPVGTGTPVRMAPELLSTEFALHTSPAKPKGVRSMAKGWYRWREKRSVKTQECVLQATGGRHVCRRVTPPPSGMASSTHRDPVSPLFLWPRFLWSEMQRARCCADGMGERGAG